MPTTGRAARDEWPSLRPRWPSWEDLRASLWFWPAVTALVAFAVGSVLGNVHPTAGSSLAQWAWPGDRESATAFLQVVAGSVITVTSLTFTLVVVALQLASQQFSPRLLREFARDLVTQVVLGILVATFVVSVTVLRGLEAHEPVPALGLGLTLVLVLASISALLGFLGHIARLVRVDTMMATAHRASRRVIERHYLPYGSTYGGELPARAEHARTTVEATRSGFVQDVDVEALVDAARACDAFVVLGVRAGDHVATGTPIARVAVDGPDGRRLADAVRDAVGLGYERTLQQDLGLGLRQLTDIAVKALSPAVNDPTTATHAVGHLTDLLIRLLDRRLGPVVHEDADGIPRARTPDRDLRYYLDLAIGPIRRYGSREPLVLVALLRLLRDVAVSARDDEQRAELERQVRLVVDSADAAMLDADLEDVRDAERSVADALRGDVLAAFEDRAGETRSS